MISKPGNHYKAWTADQVGELRRLLDEGTTLPMIARVMGRSPEAVGARMKFEKALARQAEQNATAANMKTE